MRRVPVVAAIAVVVVVGGGVLLARIGDDDGTRPAVAATVPDAWRIVYEVTTGEAEVTDVVVVRRPFESALDTAERRGGPRLSSQVAAFARLRQSGRGGEPSVLAVPPAPAPSDVRLDVVLDDAVDRGLLVPRERRTVAGRPCRVYRSGALLTSGVLIAPGEDEYADSCIDRLGLVLDEELVVDGESVVRRTATRVELDPVVDERAFVTGEPTVPASAGGGSVLPLAPGTGRPGPFWVLDDPPDGFEPCGRFSVVPPQAVAGGVEEVPGGDQRVASVAQVFVRGRDLVVVDQGATLQGGSPFALGGGERVDLGAVGDGELVLGTQASEVRAVLAGGGYLRVLGTLAPDDLVAVARALRETDGGDRLQVLQDGEPVCRGDRD